MGLMCSWMAVQAPKTAVLDAVGLKELGVETYPGTRTHPFSIGELPNGWVVVFSEDFDWMTDDRPSVLAPLGPVVACRFEDKVAMTCVAWALVDSKEVWRVAHDLENDPRPLVVTGAPPEGFDAIRRRLEAEQQASDAGGGGVDYIFDAPLEAAKLTCGFRMDEWEPAFMAAGFAGPQASPDRGEPGPIAGFISRLLGWR